jgi:hypothetical protein
MPNRLNINDFIAFTAAKFHAALTTSFFIDYAQRILIEGFELRSLLDNMLIPIPSWATHQPCLHPL